MATRKFSGNRKKCVGRNGTRKRAAFTKYPQNRHFLLEIGDPYGSIRDGVAESPSCGELLDYRLKMGVGRCVGSTPRNFFPYLFPIVTRKDRILSPSLCGHRRCQPVVNSRARNIVKVSQQLTPSEPQTSGMRRFCRCLRGADTSVVTTQRSAGAVSA